MYRREMQVILLSRKATEAVGNRCRTLGHDPRAHTTHATKNSLQTIMERSNPYSVTSVSKICHRTNLKFLTNSFSQPRSITFSLEESCGSAKRKRMSLTLPDRLMRYLIGYFVDSMSYWHTARWKKSRKRHYPAYSS